MTILDDLLEHDKKGMHHEYKNSKIKPYFFLYIIVSILLIICIMFLTKYGIQIYENSINQYKNTTTKKTIHSPNKLPKIEVNAIENNEKTLYIRREKQTATLFQLYLNAEQWENAKHLIDFSLKKNPESITYNLLKAQWYEKKGLLDAALYTLNSMSPELAQHTDYYGLKAKLYLEKKEHKLATKLYKKLTEIQPLVGKWWVGLGLSFEQAEKLQQAEISYLRAREVEKNNLSVQLYLDKKIAKLTKKNLAAQKKGNIYQMPSPFLE